MEIHVANGYLVHQFLSDSTNQRRDSYGGSIDNRIRFAVEVAAAVANEIGADRTGLRISPGNAYNDITESDTAELYPELLRALSPLGLALSPRPPRWRRCAVGHTSRAMAVHADPQPLRR